MKAVDVAKHIRRSSFFIIFCRGFLMSCHFVCKSQQTPAEEHWCNHFVASKIARSNEFNFGLTSPTCFVRCVLYFWATTGRVNSTLVWWQDHNFSSPSPGICDEE